MINRRNFSLSISGIAAALFVLAACSQPPAEAPKPQGPPLQVVKVVKAPQGDQTAEIVQRGDKKMVRLDGSLGPEYEDIDGLVFMADSHQLAYEAKREGKWLLVLDGKEWPVDAEVVHDSIQVSPDHRRLAFLGRGENKWQAMLDGKPGPRFDFIWAETLKFSGDSKHLGYLALDGDRLAVVVDGKVKKRLDIMKEGRQALAEVLQDLAEEPAK